MREGSVDALALTSPLGERSTARAAWPSRARGEGRFGASVALTLRLSPKRERALRRSDLPARGRYGAVLNVKGDCVILGVRNDGSQLRSGAGDQKREGIRQRHLLQPVEAARGAGVAGIHVGAQQQEADRRS